MFRPELYPRNPLSQKLFGRALAHSKAGQKSGSCFLLDPHMIAQYHFLQYPSGLSSNLLRFVFHGTQTVWQQQPRFQCDHSYGVTSVLHHVRLGLSEHQSPSQLEYENQGYRRSNKHGLSLNDNLRLLYRIVDPRLPD